MLLFYHGDMDGIVSAFLYVKNIKPTCEIQVRYIEFEYDKQELIKKLPIGIKLEDCVFVDCCPNEDILNFLLKYVKSCTIIDHHLTTQKFINDYHREGLIEGMSYIGASASLITWCWFKFDKNIEKITVFLDSIKNSVAEQNKNLPLALKLVNSWDIWNGMYIDAEPYKVYFESQGLLPTDKRIDKLLFDNLEVRKAIREGNIMVQFFHNWGDIYCKNYGYEVQYLKYNFFVLNVGNANSKIFGNRINDYDAVIIYCNNGLRYKCSIYSTQEDFNCAEFAKNFGGGGHQGAAGFTLNTLPIWLRDRKSGLLLKEEDNAN